MSKTVKLDDKTYQELEKFRGKRETFSGAVDRLLTIKDGVSTMVDVLEGSDKFREYREKHNADAAGNDVRGDLAQVSDVPTGEMDRRPA